TKLRLPRPSVSRNVSRKPSFIAVPAAHHCKPLQVEAISGAHSQYRDAGIHTPLPLQRRSNAPLPISSS
ncbi:hypothetical protein, partial [Sphingobium sp.]|uniref:hypothetical protein n=1 Tax=Sphingobium sp. TaxID=1912891 RepID=UPI00257EB142